MCAVYYRRHWSGPWESTVCRNRVCAVQFARQLAADGCEFHIGPI